MFHECGWNGRPILEVEEQADVCDVVPLRLPRVAPERTTVRVQAEELVDAVVRRKQNRITGSDAGRLFALRRVCHPSNTGTCGDTLGAVLGTQNTRHLLITPPCQIGFNTPIQ